MDDAIVWPKKSREFLSNHFDSTVWNDFPFRDDDIIISTYGKSGTTWTQQIVAQLVFRGQEGLPIGNISPWLDFCIMPMPEIMQMLEAQTHRRFIKTHLPLDAFVFNPKVKHIYCARDGRDIAWSFWNHYYYSTDAILEAINTNPRRAGPRFDRLTGDAYDFYLEWMEKDGFPLWSLWDNVRSWWTARELPNVLMLHFNNLKADLEGEMRRIADFLEIEIEEELWPRLVEHCSFEYMRKNGEATVPQGGIFWQGGAKRFLHKGTNGRWRDTLTPEECAAYEAKALAELGPECAHWLATGEMPAHQPA